MRAPCQLSHGVSATEIGRLRTFAAVLRPTPRRQSRSVPILNPWTLGRPPHGGGRRVDAGPISGPRIADHSTANSPAAHHMPAVTRCGAALSRGAPYFPLSYDFRHESARLFPEVAGHVASRLKPGRLSGDLLRFTNRDGADGFFHFGNVVRRRAELPQSHPQQ